MRAAIAAHAAGAPAVVKADAITLVREVKALAQKAGGYANLRQLVDALAE